MLSKLLLFVALPVVLGVVIVTDGFACTGGVATGAATADGRPLFWFNLDVPYKESHVALSTHNGTNVVSIKRPIYSSPGAPSLNTHGIATAPNSQYSIGPQKNWSWGFIAGSCTNISDVRSHFGSKTAASGYSYPVIDKNGNAAYFEDAGNGTYWEYDVQNSSRHKNPDFNYSSPNLFAVRANDAFKNKYHQELDATINAWSYHNKFRYTKARDEFAASIVSAKLTAYSLLKVARFGNTGYDSWTISRPMKNDDAYTSRSAVVLGVNQKKYGIGDHPKYAVMLAGLGIPDYTIYIPVWAALSSLSPFVDAHDSSSIGYWSIHLFDDKYKTGIEAGDDDYINNLFADLQTNIIEGVSAARSKWFSTGDQADYSNTITEIHERSAWCAYQSIRSAYHTAGGGRSCNDIPKITSMSATPTGGNSISCSASASDKNGIKEYSWMYGDGSTSATGATQTHTYAKPGSYLVSVIAKDSHSHVAANVVFKWVTVGSKCGNSLLDPGETCDPPASCPGDCDDDDACTRDLLTGSAANCSARCSYSQITECKASDGCCPAGCDASTDEDCKTAVVTDAGPGGATADQATPGPGGDQAANGLVLAGGCQYAAASRCSDLGLLLVLAVLFFVRAIPLCATSNGFHKRALTPEFTWIDLGSRSNGRRGQGARAKSYLRYFELEQHSPRRPGRARLVDTGELWG